jgi:nitrate reductase (NAD(P)H)
MRIDSETAKAMMSGYHVGTLDKAAIEALKNESNSGPEQGTRDNFLQPRHWMKAKLCKKRIVSQDSRIFTFTLEHDRQKLGLQTGQHLMLKVADPSSAKDHLLRAYTPISQTDQLGTMELLVKIYFETSKIKGGKMTTALDNLAIGSVVEFKGPVGKFTYLGNGMVSLNGKERSVTSFRMICGGSGITPIFQVLRAVMQDAEDKTTCVVLDGNKSEDDILCREDLDYFAAADSSKCSIIHTLTNASSSWTGLRGRISAGHLKEHVSPRDDCLVLICGPEAMEKSVGQTLLELGWDKSDVVFF